MILRDLSVQKKLDKSRYRLIKKQSIKENIKNYSPPMAEKISHKIQLHGKERVDEYFWLKEKDNPDVIEYLNAENNYTDEMTSHTKDIQESLYKEMVGRINETDLTVPEKRGKFYYYTRTEKGKQYPIFVRKEGSLEAEEELLIDQNEMAKGIKFFELGALEISPNHNLLAFSVDNDGSERFTLKIKNLVSGEILSDEIKNIGYSVVWGNDNNTLFYNTLDDTHRPYKVFRHVIGDESDSLVYHENDKRYFLYPQKTKDDKFLLLSSGSANSSEVRYLSADDPFGKFAVIHPRQALMEYSVYHHGNKFLIVTNEDAINFKLMEAPDSAPSHENWKELIPNRKDVKLDSLDIFEEFMVAYERKNGLKQIRVKNMVDSGHHYVDFPEAVYTFTSGGNNEFKKKNLRITYMSLTTPKTVLDYDMDSMKRNILKEYEVLGGYDKKNYSSERIFAIAEDGTQIPISIVFKNDFEKDGTRPALLYGYGSYGSSKEPSFDSNLISLLDRGFVYAIAHIRGGGEMGRGWYDDGKLKRKMNTFTDFIACAEFLIDKKYTNKERLAIYGGSAGGLLMGAVLNMRAELFKFVLASVPFVDVVNTMLDESIPLTAIEWEEWGNPKTAEDYYYMMKYSPYDNVGKKEYPNMLVKAGLNDPRVGYWEPAKWIAKLRTEKTDNNFLLLQTKMGEGHLGASGRYNYLKEKAFEYAIILDALEISI